MLGNEKMRFFYEMEIMKKLDHPNILRIFEVYQDQKRYYLITELCTGGELFDEIAKKSVFSEKDAAVIIEQILEAISYCHSRSIVHRDLKPENILIDSQNNNNIKVIDFGTSQKMQPKVKMNQAFGTSYYIAPEVLYTDYDEKCDVWSIGVIMYILLSGKPPFDGEADKEICRKVKEGKYSLAGEEWDEISLEAKDLLKKLLTYDPRKRVSCAQALQHEWFALKVEKDTDAKQTLSALHNLKEFRAEKKLQQAAITFIVSQLASKEEMDELQKAFKALDINKSGVLSREELLIGYKELMGDLAEAEVDRIMALADTDKSGAIDYSEWVVATINKNQLLSDEKMRQAFDLFDKDGGGTISASEVKEVLGIGKKFDERIWEEIIGEVDIDGDGEISYSEFKAMMDKLLSDAPVVEDLADEEEDDEKNNKTKNY